ncbi:MAG: hypothetical protein ACFBWO_16315 [Paracoccaceae bacterium]
MYAMIAAGVAIAFVAAAAQTPTMPAELWLALLLAASGTTGLVGLRSGWAVGAGGHAGPPRPKRQGDAAVAYAEPGGMR